MQQILKKFGERILYGFGFGLGMGVSFKIVGGRSWNREEKNKPFIYKCQKEPVFIDVSKNSQRDMDIVEQLGFVKNPQGKVI